MENKRIAKKPGYPRKKTPAGTRKKKKKKTVDKTVTALKSTTARGSDGKFVKK